MGEDWIDIFPMKTYKGPNNTGKVGQSLEKAEIPPSFDSMDGPWWHYAKWIESDREKQILNYLTYIWKWQKNSEAKACWMPEVGMGSGRKVSKDMNLFLNMFWDVLHGIVTMLTISLYIEIAERVDLWHSHHKEKNLWGDRC